MEIITKDIDDLTQRARANQDGVYMEYNIDVSISEMLPSFIGFPEFFSYAPHISISTRTDTYILKGKPQESPSMELIRCRTRVRALELGLEAAKSLEAEKLPPMTGLINKNKVKVNDLPLTEAERQLETYRSELARVEEATKGFMYY